MRKRVNLNENFYCRFSKTGIRPDKLIEEQDTFYMLIIRDNFINNKHKLKYTVVFGHITLEKSYSEDNKIGINTGCGKYPFSPLTAFKTQRILHRYYKIHTDSLNQHKKNSEH